MTVRAWFRQLRREAWDGAALDGSTIVAYFRPEDPREWPLSPPVELRDLVDYQKLIAEGVPERADTQIRRAMQLATYPTYGDRTPVSEPFKWRGLLE